METGFLQHRQRIDTMTEYLRANFTAIAIGFAVGWVSHSQLTPSAPDRPILRVATQLARWALFFTFAVEKPPEDTVMSVAPDADGYYPVDHSRAF